MEFRVNGATYKLQSGSFAAKSRFGKNAFLVKRKPQSGSTQLSQAQLSQAEISQDSLYSSTLGTSAQEVTEICAVDARGHFVVEPNTDYGVSTFCIQETYVNAIARRLTREMAALKQKTSTGGLPRESKKSESNRSSVIPSTRRRPPTKYNMFVKEFNETFTNASFWDAASEWALFSEDQKKKTSLDALVNSVVASGKYQLAKRT